MKIKPIFLYLGALLVFILAVVIFSDNTKKADKPAPPVSENQQMPDDDVHSKMKSQGNGDAPSKANVMEDAMKKLEELKLVVEKNPSDTLKMREYADMLTMAHQADKAEKYYQTIYNKDPKRIDILMQLTYVAYQQGQLDKAEDFTNKIIKLDPKSVVGAFNLAAIAQAKGDQDKAYNLWSKVAKENPNTEVGHMAAEAAKQIETMKKNSK